MTAKTLKNLTSKADFVKIDISTEGAAEMSGLGAERIRQLAKEGWIKKIGRDRYSASAVVRGIIDYKDDQLAKASRSGSSTKLQDARAAEIELRMAERKEVHLVEAQEFMFAFLDDTLGPLKPDCLAIPPRVTRDVVMRRQIEEQIEAAFDAAADRIRERAKLPESELAKTFGKRRSRRG